MPAHRKTKNAQNREIDVLPTPLSETPEFLAYEPQVESLVLKTKCGVTQSEIDRVLQPPHPSWTQLALERLFESIEDRQVGVFTKYFPRKLRRIDVEAHSNPRAGLFPEGAHRYRDEQI